MRLQLRIGISLLFCSTLLISCQSFNKKKSTIYMIGDSTMSIKDENRRPETGWGEKIHLYFEDGIRFENHAKNGRSSKSFMAESRWDTVYQKLQKGDYVFIQFGHNDESKNKGERYSTPEEYKNNLRKYVTETQAKGAVPVLFTSVVRRRFDENHQFEESHGEYPDIVRSLANELSVPLIDMQALSKASIVSMGEETSKKVYLHLAPGESENYPDGLTDDTHFSTYGATYMAQVVATAIAHSDLYIRRYLIKPSS